MAVQRYRHLWIWIAVFAIMAAVVLLIAPQAHSGPANAWLAMLPVFFVGLLTPLSFEETTQSGNEYHIPAAPALQPSFQRPPPSLNA